MVTTARPHPMPAAAHRPAAHRPPARPTPRPGATLTTTEVSSRQVAALVVQGTLIAGGVLAVLAGVAFFFGDTIRSRLFTIGGVPTAAAPAGPGPTVFYRDRGDGTVTVMEIDGNGTRLKGTISRNDVPLLQADKVRAGWGGESTSGPNSRVNALGSAFR